MGRPKKVKQAIHRVFHKGGEVAAKSREWRTYAAPFFAMPLAWRNVAPAQAAGHIADAPEAPADASVEGANPRVRP